MNVEGLTCKGGINVAKMERVIDCLESRGANVGVVTETWVKSGAQERELRVIAERRGWAWFGKKRKNRNPLDKRGSGGVGVLVKLSMGKAVLRGTRADGVVWVEISSTFTSGLRATLHIVGVYLASTGKRKGHNERAGSEIVRVMSEIGGEEVVVMGDGNGRIGDLKSIVEGGGQDEDAAQIAVREERVVSRVCEDKVVTTQGKWVMELMNSVGAVVVNGTGGVTMPITFVGPMGQSTPDFIAYRGESEIGAGPMVVVDSDIEVGSDHRMVFWSLPSGGSWRGVQLEELNEMVEEEEERGRMGGWKRKDGGEREYWQEMIELGEKEMKEWVEEWTERAGNVVEGDGQVVVSLDWQSYKMRAHGVLEHTIGRTRCYKKGREKWYKIGYDSVVDELKRRATVVRKKIRGQAEGRGAETIEELRRELVELRVGVKKRIEIVLKERATELMKKIEDCSVKDPKQGWNLLKEGVGGGKEKAEIEVLVDKEGREGRGEEVLRIVKEAWEELGVEDINDARYDIEFGRLVREQVRGMEDESREEECEALDKAIDYEEVEMVVRKMVKGKAAGCDEIITEWLKFGGKWMTLAVWLLVRDAWALERMTNEWGDGMIRPVFKKGDRKDPYCYRGITLLSVVGKVLMAVINNRLTEWVEDSGWAEGGGAVSDEQGGFRRGRGCPEQIFVLTEVLGFRKGKKTYCCFVDVKKAYDRVWRDGMLKRLWEVGVRGKMWRVLKNSYESVKSCGAVNGGRSDWFDIEVGLRQGCVLSPLIYNIFIDGLAKRIIGLDLGVEVDEGGRLSLLLYADDIVMIADSPEDLQRMVNELREYCRLWRFEINLDRGKTEVVVYGGPKKGVEGVEIWYGDKKINVVSGYTYLGMEIDKGGGWRRYKEKMIRKTRRRVAEVWGMLLRIGKMTVKAGVRIWQALVRPLLEFGAEVWESERNWVWEEAERIQKRMGKWILGVRESACDEGVLGELGWISLAHRRASLRVGFWGKIIGQSDRSWVRRVYNESRRRYVVRGEKNWASYTHAVMIDMGLGAQWDSEQPFFLNEEGEVRVSWKEGVKGVVRDQAEVEWREGMERKRQLGDYRRWKVDLVKEEYLEENVCRRGRKLLTRLRIGASCLRVETGKWEMVTIRGVGGDKRVRIRREDRVCRMCGGGIEDTRHVFFDCLAYEGIRRDLWEGLGVGEQDDRELRLEKAMRGDIATLMFLEKAFEFRGRILGKWGGWE
jgi:hypothetical protein